MKATIHQRYSTQVTQRIACFCRMSCVPLRPKRIRINVSFEVKADIGRMSQCDSDFQNLTFANVRNPALIDG